jgi:Asp-tRNA(Asn)/Glu-tRNA(Gln) amidotransferase A subunit family amidase
MKYTRAKVKAPRLSGAPLKAFVRALESAAGPLILGKLVKDSGIDRFRTSDAGDASPIQVPLPLPVELAPQSSSFDLARNAVRAAKTAPLETVGAFHHAYSEHLTNPVQVIRQLHDTIERFERNEPKMNFFIARKPDAVLAVAEASAQRWARREPLSVLDGVPVVLKDEVDLAGFPTTLGTRFRNAVAHHDSTVAARLKAAGALILGKANMNEIGINPIGLNPHYGPARNPWNPRHITGGSSSASAAVVAAGLCPISIGADGGGSIRIPAALCGVVGLKATFGRISEAGVPPLCWNVGHIGPIGLTVRDVAATYAIIAGADERDPVSTRQPGVHLAHFEENRLAGIRIGLCQPYFDDADPEVVARCREGVRALVDAGATVVDLPPPDLNLILWSHAIIILSEMREAMHEEVLGDSSRFALDSRTNLAIGHHFTSRDYVHAMRHRHNITREWLGLMQHCDVAVTPTTACTAPLIPEQTLPDGESNLVVVDQLMRFIRIANLTGFPAISVPVGLDSRGLPVGLQLMGRPFEENVLLRLGLVIEGRIERRVPSVHVGALRA